MVRGFYTKKIKSEKTLGEILKSARKKKGFSIADAESATKVRAKFLEALEETNWKILPQSIYVRGFVLAYAKYLELPKEEILKTYEREAKVRSSHQKTKISYNQSVKEKRILITPKFLGYSALSIFVISMVSYIAFQVLNFAGNPNLEIISPENNLISEIDAINLSGVTDTDTNVSVNNETVPVSSDGKFLLTLKLHNGVNVIKVKAVNKVKKESSKVYTIEYKPKTASIDNASAQ